MVINYLAHIKATGTPKALAGKLNVRERTVYKYIRLLRELGAPIKYSSKAQSYFYDDREKHLIYLNRILSW